MNFRAYQIIEQDGKSAGRFVELTLDDLDSGEVVIAAHYSSVNYKDALVATGTGKVIRRFPCVGGIDVSGVVTSSSDTRFKVGDEVLVTGYDMGVAHDGGFAEYVRVPADCVVSLPQGMTLFDATFVEVPRQRNRRAENALIKEDAIPLDWGRNPHKLAQKDTDARWTQKHHTNYYGYKNHINADHATKLIQAYQVTDASDHDSRVFDERLDHTQDAEDRCVRSCENAAKAASTDRLMGLGSARLSRPHEIVERFPQKIVVTNT